MKKAALALSAAIVCGALVGYQCIYNNKPAAQEMGNMALTVQQTASTRLSEQFIPEFNPVVVPEHMKQHYTLNPKAAQVITGNSGTILLIPDNAFKDRNGNPVEGKVKLELVEAVTRQDLIEMHLGTMSDQGMLETGGSFFIGAKSESGEELALAENKVIDIEVPTFNKKTGMQLWEGVANEDGSISWKNPEPMKETITEVPISTLAEDLNIDEEAILSGENKTAVVGNVQMINRNAVPGERFGWFMWNDNGVAALNNSIGVDTGLIGLADPIFQGDREALAKGEAFASLTTNGRLDIVNFADKKFEKTNISTAEFRSRLPFIKQACDTRIAHCYADYPNRALWKSDAAAADSLERKGCPLAEVFRQFAQMKQGKIDPKDPHTVAALDAARQKAIENYSKRMQASMSAYMPYKFGMKKLGWANIDRLYNSGKPIVFNAEVIGQTQGLSPKVSLLIPGRGIYLPGYRRPNGNYSFTHGENEQAMAYPQGERALIVVESGTDNNFKYAVKEIIFGGDAVEKVILKSGTKQQLDMDLGNIPEAESNQVKIIDDWYTQSIKEGGCVCGAMTATMK